MCLLAWNIEGVVSAIAVVEIVAPLHEESMTGWATGRCRGIVRTVMVSLMWPE